MRSPHLALAAVLAAATAEAQRPEPAPFVQPDERFKADLLLVVAHPDDDTLVASYLAKAIHDEGKRVALIYGTRGDAGGNAVGEEQAASLGAVREIEARRALGSLGIQNVWFLGGRDTASQDVLQSLESWGHGAALEQTVRLVRLTRPDVMLTWLPRVVAGENHGDHQAAAVIATEAFDLAGDPTAFPAQVAPPRLRTSIRNLTEGLRPWQPAKLYFFSDASDTRSFEGRGPQYSLKAISPSRKVSYASLAAQEASHYRTQIDDVEVRQLLDRGDWQTAVDRLMGGEDPWLPEPLRLLLGKSLVEGSATDDVFAAIGAGPRRHRAEANQTAVIPGAMSVALGGPWAFYRSFWQAHGLEALEELGPAEIAVAAGASLRVPLLVRNGSTRDQEVTVKTAAPLPSGWKEESGSGRYMIPAGESLTIQALLATAGPPSREWRTLSYAAEASGKSLGSITLRVLLRPGGLPQ